MQRYDAAWRMQNSWPNRERINRLLAERLENAPDLAARITELISARSGAVMPSPPAI
jgi:hypothetical protein